MASDRVFFALVTAVGFVALKPVARVRRAGESSGSTEKPEKRDAQRDRSGAFRFFDAARLKTATSSICAA
ncbi:hypothetical protein MCBRY_003426 [Methylocystis bryophila]